MDKQKKIRISISIEHADILTFVKKVFSGLKCSVSSDYVRGSAEDLPMQIIIFLGGAIVSGVTWDLIKAGVWRLFRKYPQIRVTIRDKNNIIFSIKRDWKVGVLVVPDRKKEFAHIRNIYGLGKYLVKETKEDRLEYRKRFDFVLGVVVAGVLGWLINIFSNLYYDVFLTHSAKFSSFDPLHLAILASLFFAVIAFLQFLVYDHKNELTLEKSFWKRYLFFLSEDFSLSRMVKFVNKFFISMFLIIFDFSILITLNNYAGLIPIGAVLSVSVVMTVVRNKWFKNKAYEY